MLTLTMLKGLPGSGKTTWAKGQIDKAPVGSIVRVNKDELRAMMHNSRFCNSCENSILVVRDFIVKGALRNGIHAIVDDTNFSPKHEERLRKIIESVRINWGVIAKFETKFFDVPVEECLKRNNRRPNPVPETVILNMYHKWVRKEPEPYPVDPLLSEIVICDLDGTICEMGDRSPFSKDGECFKDIPRWPVIDALHGLNNATSAIMFFSGRFGTEKNREATLDWLRRYVDFSIGRSELHMRDPNDQRRDSIVKQEMFDRYVRGKYNVYAVLDDRPQVIEETWIPLGLGNRMFNVGSGRRF